MAGDAKAELRAWHRRNRLIDASSSAAGGVAGARK
jgi:hypothetical protein